MRKAILSAFVAIAFGFLALAVAEGYLAYQQKASYYYEGGYTERYYDRTSSTILGYRPLKNTIADSRLYIDDELVYDVTYSIDANGLRVAPPVAYFFSAGHLPSAKALKMTRPRRTG